MGTSDQEKPNEQAAERPIGVEEQKTLESQERGAEKSIEATEVLTTTPAEMVDEVLESSKVRPAYSWLHHSV